MNPITWIRRLRYIVANIPELVNIMRDDLARAHDKADGANWRIAAVEKVLREHTVVHMDVACHRGDETTVIVTGSWRNHDSVLTYKIRPADLAGVVDHLDQLTRHHRTGMLDAPPVFRAFVEHSRRTGKLD